MTEPVTLLTDYLLGLFTGVLAARLLARGSTTAGRFWGAALAATALAAITGGTYHGFTSVLAPGIVTLLWKITTFAIGLASCVMLVGTALATVREPIRRVILVFAVLKFLVYVTWMTGHDEFRYVIYDYAPAMLIVIILLLIGFKLQREAAPWLLGGIAVSLAAAGVQASGFALHRHFNHNDLYHVIQMAAMYLLYRGARSFKSLVPRDQAL